MKKLLLIVLLLSATFMTARADGEHYTYDGGEYHEATVLYIALKGADGAKLAVDDATYYLGAFIGDEAVAVWVPTTSPLSWWASIPIAM